MSSQLESGAQISRGFVDHLKDAAAVFLVLVFVVLYAAAFAGKLDPLKDSTVLLRLEPPIFILIGFCLARIQTRRAERTLANEIERQTRRAEAAQIARETAIQEREVLEEKIRNASIAIEGQDPKTASRILRS